MAKWVTFYEDMDRGVQDYVEHPNKEAATKYFEKNHEKYFQLNIPIKVKLPMFYGFPPFRYYCGMSLKKFKMRG